MVAHAVAREAICALRRKIANIEGVPAERLDLPDSQREAMLVRRGKGRDGLHLATGAAGLDAVLGGGLPLAALTEIVGTATRDSGATAGFALGLAARLVASSGLPLLWIGTAEIFREGGYPYPPGLVAGFGLSPERLLLGTAPKLSEALWMAEEAAALPDIGAVMVELRGNPDRLDLTATRRLHWRARHAGRPVFLLRQGAQAEPTAAPLRLLVEAAPAAPRRTLAGILPTSVGRPAFAIAIGKWRGTHTGRFILEWNCHGLAFEERQPQDSRRLVPLARPGADMAAEAGTLVAFPAPAAAAAGAQPPARKQPARRFTG